MSTTCRCWNCPPITPTNRQAARRHPHVGARNITQANIQNRRFASVTATEIKKTSKPFLQPSHLKHIVHLFVKAPVPNGRKYNGGSAGLVLRYSLAGQACDLNPIGTPPVQQTAGRTLLKAPAGLLPGYGRFTEGDFGALSYHLQNRAYVFAWLAAATKQGYSKGSPGQKDLNSGRFRGRKAISVFESWTHSCHPLLPPANAPQAYAR